MSIEAEPHAIAILEILDDLPRHELKINGPALLSIIEKEIKKEQLNIGFLKKSFEWIKINGPRVAEGILVRLIPSVIMKQLG